MSAAQPKDRFEDYIPVHERVSAFYEKHPDGRILTSIVNLNEETGFVLMRAEVYRNPDDAMPSATGHAYEIQGQGFVNKTSHVENCETGCVGRALALLGFEVKRGIASREEMQKTTRPRPVDKPVSDEDASRSAVIYQIMEATEALGYKETQLDKKLAAQFGDAITWRRRPVDQLRWLLDGLHTVANKKAAKEN